MILSISYHLPVLLPEVIDGLNIKKGAKYIDATIGGGGYSVEILRRGGVVLGIDADKDAIDYIKKVRINSSEIKIGQNLFLKQGNFADIKKIVKRVGFGKISGILLDLGMSTYQLEHSGRGFSYLRDEPLDMRMDERQKLKASDIINNYSKEALYEIFTKFAEELYSGAIVSAILRARSLKKILTTNDLVTTVENAQREALGEEVYEIIRNDTLARLFQALRITVNDEIDNLKKVLQQTEELLLSQGRVAVLSYHSLEDRVVKSFFKHRDRAGTMQILTKKAMGAGYEEIKLNPKSRSVRLRIAQKL